MKRAHPERDLHIAVAQYLALMEKSGRLRFFHAPNGERRDAQTGALLKRMGVKKGIPDFIVFISCCSRHTFDHRNSARPIMAAIEIKSSVGKLTQEQEEWMDFLGKHGWRTAVVRSLDDVIKLIEKWME